MGNLIIRLLIVVGKQLQSVISINMSACSMLLISMVLYNLEYGNEISWYANGCSSRTWNEAAGRHLKEM